MPGNTNLVISGEECLLVNLPVFFFFLIGGCVRVCVCWLVQFFSLSVWDHQCCVGYCIMSVSQCL